VLEAGAAARVGRFLVETFAVPGHTADGVAFRIRAAGLLAVGDHLSPCEYPFVESTAAYRASLAALIDVLRSDPPEQVAPGHGPLLSVPEALAIAEEDQAYLRSLRVAVAAALTEGASREDAIAAGLSVAPPRPAWDDLDDLSANVLAQIAELYLPET
jgi:glyoxylase-like metal-dependent hydrolase (beta-lactamase superfamily II)